MNDQKTNEEKFEVLITGALHPEAVKGFMETPHFNVDYSPDLDRNRLFEKLPGKHILVTRSETKVDQELMEVASELKIVGRAAVGVGNIDLDYATEKGILVINTPGRNTNSAAEMTLALLLGMFRNVPQAHAKVKSGGWDRHSFTGRELRGKKIGLVGLGHVGHRVAKFCLGFDMEVFGYDPYIGASVFRKHGVVRCETLNELLETADILSVHVPLNSETRSMIDLPQLERLKKGAWVVNAARGGIIDESALTAKLKDGHIKAAAVDTWVGEPEPSKELVGLENVFVAPHIGASTLEAQKAIGETIVEQIRKAADGGVVDFPVNLPQIGVVTSPLLKPYTVLAEKLGSFSAQILGFNPSNIQISYRGDLAGNEDYSLIKLGFKKGYASTAVDTYVSYVNADTHFEQLGIELDDEEDPNFTSYRSALKIVVTGPKGKKLAVGGVVFDQEYPRISLVNDYYFEVDPSGHFVVVENEDKPGVIGAIGTLLAGEGVNIDSFDLARNKKGGKAMAMIKVDSPIDSDLRRKFLALEHIVSAHFVTL